MHKTISLITRSCALLIALIAGAYAQTPKLPIDLSFEQKVTGWLKETNVPAAGIGIIENGKLKYIKVFGELKKVTYRQRSGRQHRHNPAAKVAARIDRVHKR